MRTTVARASEVFPAPPGPMRDTSRASSTSAGQRVELGLPPDQGPDHGAGGSSARAASRARGLRRRGRHERRGWSQVGRASERLVLPQHPLVQGPQRERRLQPERLVQDVAGAGVDLQRVGLPATAVQRHHQQAGHGLQGGVLGHERLEVGDDLLVPAEREGDLGTFGDRGELAAR